MADILPDLPDDFDDSLCLDDAVLLASRVLQMCERIRTMEKFETGAIASTVIDIDGCGAFELIVRRASS